MSPPTTVATRAVASAAPRASQGRTQRSSSAPSQRRKGSDAARTAAYDVLRAVDGTDSYANLVLPPLLRERRIDAPRRGVRHRARLRHAAAAGPLRRGHRAGGRRDRPSKIDPPVLDVLRLGAHQLLGMRVPAHAAVSETVGLAREQLGAGAVAVRQRGAARGRREPLRGVGGAHRTPTGTTSSARSPRCRATRCGWSARCARRWSGTAGRPTRSRRCSSPTTSRPRVTVVARPGLADADEVLADAPRLDARRADADRGRPGRRRPGGAGRACATDAPGCRTRAASWSRSP